MPFPKPLPLLATILLIPGLSGVAAAQSPSSSALTVRHFPKDLETDLALSALPEHLRAGAGVFLLEDRGYVRVRESQNGFECLVRQHGAVPGTFSDSIAPFCYDREGSKTLLPAVLDEVRMLQEGVEPPVVAETIARKWEDGDYTLPGPGISYMLSPIFRLNGRDGVYVPHLMFYAPYKVDADVGASGDRFDYVPYIQGPGRPSSVMVVPVGIEERAAIAKQQEPLLEKVRALLSR